MTKVMIESVKKMARRAGAKDDCFFVSIDGKEMPCFDSEIEGKEGQEVEGEVKVSKANKQYFKVAGGSAEERKGGKWDGKETKYGGGYKSRSPEDLALTAKTMSASYAKDICVAFKSPEESFNRVLEMFGQAYDAVYGKITGCCSAGGVVLGGSETRQEPAKPAYKPTEVKTETKVLEDQGDRIPPPKTDRNEITCGGANAKLKGKKISNKFCEVCSFRTKCEVRNSPACRSLSEVIKPPSQVPSEPSEKSLVKESASFLVKCLKEQKRMGNEMFHNFLTTFGFKAASEIKDPEMQESFLDALATYETG